MSIKNINAKATRDLESRVAILEQRITALEKLSKKIIRRKKQYTDEERAAIRARLLAGQEAALKRRNSEVRLKLM